MFSARRYPRMRINPFAFPLNQRQKRCQSQISPVVLETTTPVSKELAATGLWSYGRWTNKEVKHTKIPRGDRNRVNIVYEDDVLEYIKPTLQRHIGCDLLDIYPGAGLWSNKLHEALRPRSHLLLEPDENVYRPMLKQSKLLDKPNVSLIPKSGIIWRELNSILNAEHLPRQIEKQITHSRDADIPSRNDTLLVTANLAFFPRRRFSAFESLSQLVLYQFINSIQSLSLFHKYGLVRMLIWVEHNDRHGLLARSCQRRRRLAIDGELMTDWISEIAGPMENSKWFVRDSHLDLASCRHVLAKMEAAGIRVPAGRESPLVQEVLADVGKRPADKNSPPLFIRPWREELKTLEAAFDAGKFAAKSPQHKRMLSLTYRENREERMADTVHALLQEHDNLAAAHETASSMKRLSLLKREAEWNAAIDALPANSRKEILLQRDNAHLFRQNPPVLLWDQREREPLMVNKTEFFPNTPCALLDIQPKAAHPLLRAMGPGSTRSGDMFEHILRGMMAAGGDAISKSIETVWPGAADGVLPYCTSLKKNVRKGGMPIGGPYGELSARSLNETQWMEILHAWMQWPFRPTLPQLVARIVDVNEVDTSTDGDVLD